MTTRKKPANPTKLAERIETARKLIGRGLYQGEIKRALANQFDVSTRTAERYITKAKREIRESVEKSDSDLIAESLEFYTSILRDRDASHRDKIKARERMDKILGIEVTRHAISMNYKEKLEELGVDPEAAMTDMREAIADALQNTTKSPGRRN